MRFLLLVWIAWVGASDFLKAQELNFEEPQLQGVVESTSQELPRLYTWGGPLLLVAFFVFLLWMSKRLFPYRPSPEKFNIQTYPVGVKRGLALGLMVYGVAFLLGAMDIIYQTRVINESTEAYFRDFGMGRMFGFTHGHLFGLATSFLIIGIPFSMQFGHSAWYQWVLIVGMNAAVTDVLSWWGLKLIGPTFEPISMICGIIFSLSYLYMLVALLRVLLFPHFMWKIWGRRKVI